MVGPEYLAATYYLDVDHPRVREFAERAVEGAQETPQRIRQLFAAVRDELPYDPYSVSGVREDYRASVVLERGKGFCIAKSVVLAATARAVGIPSRLGFADVRNHLQSERLAELMGTDLFVYHGYTELYVGEEWRKATPAFNATLCARFGVPPVEFDGSEDALLHAYSADGSRHMEYINDHGSYADLPFEQAFGAIDAAYPGLLERASSVQDAAFS